MATLWWTAYSSSPLYGETFICICNKGMMMKRKGGLQPGDQRKLIKFNWMSTFTNSNVCLSNFTKTKTPKWSTVNTRRERRFVNTECCKAIKYCKKGLICFWWANKRYIHQTRSALRVSRNVFYLWMVLIQWCLLLLKQSCWRWHRTLKGLGPRGHWGKSPAEKNSNRVHINRFSGFATFMSL